MAPTKKDILIAILMITILIETSLLSMLNPFKTSQIIFPGSNQTTIISDANININNTIFMNMYPYTTCEPRKFGENCYHKLGTSTTFLPHNYLEIFSNKSYLMQHKYQTQKIWKNIMEFISNNLFDEYYFKNYVPFGEILLDYTTLNWRQTFNNYNPDMSKYEPYIYVFDNNPNFKWIKNNTNCNGNGINCIFKPWHNNIDFSKNKNIDQIKINYNSLKLKRNVYPKKLEKYINTNQERLLTFQHILIGIVTHYTTLPSMKLKKFYSKNRQIIKNGKTYKFSEKHDTFNDKPRISLHIRAGDSCVNVVPYRPNTGYSKTKENKRECIYMEQYVEILHELKDYYKSNYIYIATDSDVAINILSNMLGNEFIIEYIIVDRDQLSGDGKQDDQDNPIFIENRQNLNMMNIGFEMAAEILLLSNGDIFIGNLGSNISRIMWYKIIGNKGFFIPFYSVDSSTITCTIWNDLCNVENVNVWNDVLYNDKFINPETFYHGTLWGDDEDLMTRKEGE